MWGAIIGAAISIGGALLGGGAPKKSERRKLLDDAKVLRDKIALYLSTFGYSAKDFECYFEARFKVQLNNSGIRGYEKRKKWHRLVMLTNGLNTVQTEMQTLQIKPFSDYSVERSENGITCPRNSVSDYDYVSIYIDNQYEGTTIENEDYIDPNYLNPNSNNPSSSESPNLIPLVTIGIISYLILKK